MRPVDESPGLLGRGAVATEILLKQGPPLLGPSTLGWGRKCCADRHRPPKRGTTHYKPRVAHDSVLVAVGDSGAGRTYRMPLVSRGTPWQMVPSGTGAGAAAPPCVAAGLGYVRVSAFERRNTAPTGAGGANRPTPRAPCLLTRAGVWRARVPARHTIDHTVPLCKAAAGRITRPGPRRCELRSLHSAYHI
jgi:hypothetical protein